MAVPLLLLRLDNGVLWQDEAESAVLARNTLHFGYPKADDGINRINPSLPLAEGQAWTYHPWATFYLTAGSFLLFGENTAAARLPSALLGLLSIWLAARLVHRLTGDRSLSRWTAFLLVISVPFLLHMRQCRYYAASVFVSLWVLWAYSRMLQERRWASGELLASLLLLFHVNHGVFVPVLLGLTLHVGWLPLPEPVRRGAWCGFRLPQPVRRRFLAVAIAALLGCLPFFFYLHAGQHHGSFSWKEISHHAQFYFRQINQYLFPITLWTLVLLIWRPRLEQLLGPRGNRLRQTLKLAICLVAAGLLFLIFGPEQRHFRYLIHLAPWFLFIQALLMVRLIQHRPWAGWLLAGVILLTDLPYSGPNRLFQPGAPRRLVGLPLAPAGAPRRLVGLPLAPAGAPIRSLPLEFLGELTHTYRGPMDGIIELLSREGKPGQTVKIPYEEHTLIFYAPALRVEPILHKEDFGRETTPDWIILRRDWLPDGFLESKYFRRIQNSYQEIVLDAPDIPWQNRPDPGYHRFRTDRSAPPVRVFRKRIA